MTRRMTMGKGKVVQAEENTRVKASLWPSSCTPGTQDRQCDRAHQVGSETEAEAPRREQAGKGLRVKLK